MRKGVDEYHWRQKSVNTYVHTYMVFFWFFFSFFSFLFFSFLFFSPLFLFFSFLFFSPLLHFIYFLFSFFSSFVFLNSIWHSNWDFSEERSKKFVALLHLLDCWLALSLILAGMGSVFFFPFFFPPNFPHHDKMGITIPPPCILYHTLT